MNTTLEKLKNVRSQCCVTIFLQTHLTMPDSEKDAIVLKNLVKQVAVRLSGKYEKPFVDMMLDRINSLAEDINHRHNKESLVLFVSENIATYVRLPVKVENRVVVDKTFATRDLIRALHQETSWYVLVLSRDKARLIEGLNDKVVHELEDGFPVINQNFYPVQRAEAAIGSRKTNLVREFFNQVDKHLNQVLKENPLPVIIYTDESNYPEYLQIADNEELIAGMVFGNRMKDKAHHILEDAWPVMKKLTDEKNKQRITELKAAVNSRNFLTDVNEIWKAVNAGKGKTLFIKQGYFQPAILENNHVELVSAEDPQRANVDDIIDEIIEKNFNFNGDAVFLNGNELEKFNGLVLVKK